MNASGRNRWIRVLLASDCRFSAEALCCTLTAMPHLFVIATVSTADAIGRMIEHAADVLLVHLAGDWNESLRLTQDLVAAAPDARVIALGVPDGEDKVLDCVEAGAKGWLPVSASVAELAQLIQTVHAGETPCSPLVAFRLFERLCELGANCPGDHEPAFPTLTARETEIMVLLGEDKSNEQIAAELYVSIPTVKKHVHSILEKMRLRSRAQLSGRKL